MTSVDLLVAGVMLLSGLIGAASGFTREVLRVAAWLGALVVSIMCVDLIRPMVARWMPSPDWADYASYVVLFLLALIVFSLIAKTIAGVVHASDFRGVDRSLGLLFGLARGAALAVAAYIIIGSWVTPVDQWPPQVLDARSLPHICKGAEWVARQVKEEYRPKVQPCSSLATRQAGQDGILNTSPSGRAPDPPPGK
jgi:membrane protein required for colicin V production